MIFVTAKDDASIFLMLSEKDIETMRAGNTKFVDQHQVGALRFNRVVLSLHNSDEEAVALLQKVGKIPSGTEFKTASPQAGECRCKGCTGIMSVGSVYEDYCIACWANMAKKARPKEDGQHRRTT